jgi:hypothetical protein
MTTYTEAATATCTLVAATVVAYKGYEYRTLDGTAPTSTSDGLQNSYMALPAGGWVVAENNADAVAVTAAYHWGTWCLVFADGDAVRTLAYSPAGSGCRTDQLYQSGNSYKPESGRRRILIRRPCAAGRYHGTSMTTYTEAATATCTLCAAGMYSPSAVASSCASCVAGKHSPTSLLTLLPTFSFSLPPPPSLPPSQPHSLPLSPVLSRSFQVCMHSVLTVGAWQESHRRRVPQCAAASGSTLP